MSRRDDTPPGRRVPPDADTAALGRRDYGFFDRQSSPRGQRDLARARPPWTGTRPRRVGAATAHDRTLGLSRAVSMWPAHTLLPVAGQLEIRHRATDILNDLRCLPPPPSTRPDVAPSRLLAAFQETAAHTRRQPARTQRATVNHIAAAHRLDPEMLLGVAHGVGTLIARSSTSASTGARPGRADGKPSLNALQDANLPLALDTYLARAHLRDSAATSDPDLPRLWMTANALLHGLPAAVIHTEPATVHGSDAALHPQRTDLVGWHGIHHALGDMDAAVRTALEGRRWLDQAGHAHGRSDTVLLALGVLHASHPIVAAELALRGPGAAPGRPTGARRPASATGASGRAHGHRDQSDLRPQRLAAGHPRRTPPPRTRRTHPPRRDDQRDPHPPRPRRHRHARLRPAPGPAHRHRP